MCYMALVGSNSFSFQTAEAVSAASGEAWYLFGLIGLKHFGLMLPMVIGTFS